MPVKKLSLAFLLLLAVLLASCAAPAPQTIEVTRVVQQTVLVTQVVEVEKIITATPAPTEPAPTAMPAVTETAPATTPLASAEGDQSFTAWCMPIGKANPDSVAQTGEMPADARPLVFNNGKPELTIQVQSCTFVYTFDQPVAPGSVLVIHDSQDQPFIKVELTPTAGDPKKAFAVITHPSIIDPQAWTIDFRVEAADPQGATLRSDVIAFKRGWTPSLCFGGVFPNAATGRCPELGEAHPWDPWYGYSSTGGYNEGVSTPGAVTTNPYAEN